MNRRALLKGLGATGAGLLLPRILTAQTRVGMLGRTLPAGVSAPSPPPGGGLTFDSFENGLDGVNGAGVNPNWNFVNEINAGASEGVIAIVTAGGGMTPVDGTHALAITTTIQHPIPDYTTDFDIQPWNVSGGAQGDNYAYERTQGGTYATGTYWALEFYMLSNAQYKTPVTSVGMDPNSDGCMQLGTYTMALSKRGTHSTQEAYGFHGYHTTGLPYTNGRWMKIKAMRCGGFRTAWESPCAICTIATTNGTPFLLYETIACSPSGIQLKFTAEVANFPSGGVTSLWGLWLAVNGVPSAGDTLTGLTSGAVRTISDGQQYISGNYSGGNNTDAIGGWTGYDPRWMMQGGCNYEWFLDYPNFTYWDRVTRFYIAAIGEGGSLTLPLVDYVDDLRWTSDTRDDVVAVSNLGAYYDPSAGKLYVTWERNHDRDFKTYDVRVSASDIQTNGWASATVWQSATNVDPGLTIMAIYATLSSPPNPLYIAIQENGRATFTQIVIGTV